MPRIAMLGANNVRQMTEHGGNRLSRALFQELRRLGYEEGRNLTVERYALEGRLDALGSFIDQIAASRPDLIYMANPTFAKRFLEAGVQTIPIVGSWPDPVALGLTTSLARPSGNITGVVLDAGGIGMVAKRIDLLRQLQPDMKHLAVLTPLYFWNTRGGIDDIRRETAQKAGLRVTGLGPSNPVQDAAYRQAFAEIDRDRPDAILVSEAVENYQRAPLVVELINEARIPALYPARDYIEAGGVMSYAIDVEGLFRHLAHQWVAVLQGRPVADVPFYQAHKYDLIVNLKSAAAQGLTIPPSLISDADEVIE
jgi:putative ABC transport system substrate-binding protein